MTDEAYNGANLTLLTGASGAQGAYAVLDGKVAVVGDVDSVKAAVDTQGKGPFATQPNPKAALDATDSSHLGFMYLDMAALLDWSSQRRAGGRFVGRARARLLVRARSAAMLPDWEGVALRVEDDAIVVEAAVDRPDSAVGPSRQSRVEPDRPRACRGAGGRASATTSAPR